MLQKRKYKFNEVVIHWQNDITVDAIVTQNSSMSSMAFIAINACFQLISCRVGWTSKPFDNVSKAIGVSWALRRIVENRNSAKNITIQLDNKNFADQIFKEPKTTPLTIKGGGGFSLKKTCTNSNYVFITIYAKLII
jgi:hypothetical protein